MKLNALILTASLGLAASAPAALYTLDYTGSFGPETTLGGTALGAETPFSLVATFDSTANFVIAQGAGGFPITSFVIVLLGTTYTAAPASTLNVMLIDLSFHMRDPASGDFICVAGLFDPASSLGYWSGFKVATPDFSAKTPTPSVLSSFTVTGRGNGPYTIALDGVAGGLVVNDVGVSPFTAEISSVPEPVQCAMMAVTFCVVVGFLDHRRHAKAAAR